MPEVLIIADPVSSSSQLKASSVVAEMKQAILASGSTVNRVTVLLTSELDPLKEKNSQDWAAHLVCPLTWNLPEWLPVLNRSLYTTCSDIDGLRQTVSQLHYEVGEGTNWLPIIWTAKGPFYGEAIAQINEIDEPTYQQPLHLVDAQRQPLYRLGQTLLKKLQASPGVYLMQFGIKDSAVWFDRLIPFPDEPAIASVGVQTPNLFECHWLCLTNQPIQDLIVSNKRA